MRLICLFFLISLMSAGIGRCRLCENAKHWPHYSVHLSSYACLMWSKTCCECCTNQISQSWVEESHENIFMKAMVPCRCRGWRDRRTSLCSEPSCSGSPDPAAYWSALCSQTCTQTRTFQSHVSRDISNAITAILGSSPSAGRNQSLCTVFAW